MNRKEISHNFLDRYLDKIRSLGKYSFTLEEMQIANVLLKNLKEKNVSPVLLYTQESKNGLLDEKWKVIINMEIESDL